MLIDNYVQIPYHRIKKIHTEKKVRVEFLKMFFFDDTDSVGPLLK